MTEAERKSLKVGDKIRCVEAVHDHKIGKIHTIKSISCGEPLMDYGGGWSAISQNGININAFELVNPEPEFKVGDEVEVLESSYETIVKGNICEVCLVLANGRIRVKKINCAHSSALSFEPHKLKLCNQDNKVQTHKTEESEMASTISREERAVEKDKLIAGYEENIARVKADIKVAKAEAKRLRDFETDRDEEVSLYMEATKKSKKEAEAFFVLRDKGINV